MRLVRSDEGMTLTTLWGLAQRWYGDRLVPGWRPRTRDQSQAILDAVGLTGDVWRLPRVR
jgi:hypothetical protein